MQGSNPRSTASVAGRDDFTRGVLLLSFDGWKSWEMVYRSRVGIADAPESRQ